MLTKEDAFKMEAKQTKGKKQEGAVYGTKGGVTEFHPLGKYQVNGEPLEKLLKQIEQNHKNLVDTMDEKIAILKSVIKSQQERLEKLEGVAKAYGSMD